jgi:hypothetical protein
VFPADFLPKSAGKSAGNRQISSSDVRKSCDSGYIYHHHKDPSYDPDKYYNILTLLAK